MIAYLKGSIVRLTPTNAILDIQGVGYDVAITLSDYTQLQGQSEAQLWITEIIREDAYILYGFLQEESRLFFEKLLGVSGVGPGTARLILSSFSPNELASLVASGSVEALKSVKGIGLKTAQRILVDLKGKIDLSEYQDDERSLSVASMAVSDEAQRALKMLGFPEPAVRKAVKNVLEATPTLSVEDVIKQALKML